MGPASAYNFMSIGMNTAPRCGLRVCREHEDLRASLSKLGEKNIVKIGPINLRRLLINTRTSPVLPSSQETVEYPLLSDLYSSDQLDKHGEAMAPFTSPIAGRPGKNCWRGWRKMKRYWLKRTRFFPTANRQDSISFRQGMAP